MEHEFQVGDKVRHKVLPYETVIDEIIGDQLWGYWTTNGVRKSMKQFIFAERAVLIEPAMMQYDPTQQGEEDDSI